jgi:hypothetical protein
MLRIALLSFLTIAISAPCYADMGRSEQQTASPNGPHERRRPPKEALSACHGKSSGATCSFTSPRGDQVQGTCWSPESSKPLACKPAHGPEKSDQRT